MKTHVLRALSVRYHVDPRSISKERERPGSVTGMAGERAREALRDPMVTPSNPPRPAA